MFIKVCLKGTLRNVYRWYWQLRLQSLPKTRWCELLLIFEGGGGHCLLPCRINYKWKYLVSKNRTTFILLYWIFIWCGPVHKCKDITKAIAIHKTMLTLKCCLLFKLSSLSEYRNLNGYNATFGVVVMHDIGPQARKTPTEWVNLKCFIRIRCLFRKIYFH